MDLKIVQFNLLILEMKKLRFKKDVICSRSYSLFRAKLDYNPGLLTLRINCIVRKEIMIFFIGKKQSIVSEVKIDTD